MDDTNDEISETGSCSNTSVGVPFHSTDSLSTFNLNQVDGCQVQDKTILNIRSSIDSNFSFPSKEPSLMDELRTSLANNTFMKLKINPRRNVSLDFSGSSSGSHCSTLNTKEDKFVMPKRRKRDFFNRPSKKDLHINFTLGNESSSSTENEQSHDTSMNLSRIDASKPVFKRPQSDSRKKDLNINFVLGNESSSSTENDQSHDTTMNLSRIDAKPVFKRPHSDSRKKDLNINFTLENESLSSTENEQSQDTSMNLSRIDASKPVFKRPQSDSRKKDLNINFTLGNESSSSTENEQSHDTSMNLSRIDASKPVLKRPQSDSDRPRKKDLNINFTLENESSSSTENEQSQSTSINLSKVDASKPVFECLQSKSKKVPVKFDCEVSVSNDSRTSLDQELVVDVSTELPNASKVTALQSTRPAGSGKSLSQEPSEKLVPDDDAVGEESFAYPVSGDGDSMNLSRIDASKPVFKRPQSDSRKKDLNINFTLGNESSSSTENEQSHDKSMNLSRIDASKPVLKRPQSDSDRPRKKDLNINFTLENESSSSTENEQSQSTSINLSKVDASNPVFECLQSKSKKVPVKFDCEVSVSNDSRTSLDQELVVDVSTELPNASKVTALRSTRPAGSGKSFSQEPFEKLVPDDDVVGEESFAYPVSGDGDSMNLSRIDASKPGFKRPQSDSRKKDLNINFTLGNESSSSTENEQSHDSSMNLSRIDASKPVLKRPQSDSDRPRKNDLDINFTLENESSSLTENEQSQITSINLSKIDASKPVFECLQSKSKKVPVKFDCEVSVSNDSRISLDQELVVDVSTKLPNASKVTALGSTCPAGFGKSHSQEPSEKLVPDYDPVGEESFAYPVSGDGAKLLLEKKKPVLNSTNAEESCLVIDNDLSNNTSMDISKITVSKTEFRRQGSRKVSVAFDCDGSSSDDSETCNESVIDNTFTVRRTARTSAWRRSNAPNKNVTVNLSLGSLDRTDESVENAPSNHHTSECELSADGMKCSNTVLPTIKDASIAHSIPEHDDCVRAEGDSTDLPKQSSAFSEKWRMFDHVVEKVYSNFLEERSNINLNPVLLDEPVIWSSQENITNENTFEQDEQSRSTHSSKCESADRSALNSSNQLILEVSESSVSDVGSMNLTKAHVSRVQKVNKIVNIDFTLSNTATSIVSMDVDSVSQSLSKSPVHENPLKKKGLRSEISIPFSPNDSTKDGINGFEDGDSIAADGSQTPASHRENVDKEDLIHHTTVINDVSTAEIDIPIAGHSVDGAPIEGANSNRVETDDQGQRGITASAFQAHQKTTEVVPASENSLTSARRAKILASDSIADEDEENKNRILTVTQNVPDPLLDDNSSGSYAPINKSLNVVAVDPEFSNEKACSSISDGNIQNDTVLPSIQNSPAYKNDVTKSVAKSCLLTEGRKRSVRHDFTPSDTTMSYETAALSDSVEPECGVYPSSLKRKGLKSHSISKTFYENHDSSKIGGTSDMTSKSVDDVVPTDCGKNHSRVFASVDAGAENNSATSSLVGDDDVGPLAVLLGNGSQTTSPEMSQPCEKNNTEDEELHLVVSLDDLDNRSISLNSIANRSDSQLSNKSNTVILVAAEKCTGSPQTERTLPSNSTADKYFRKIQLGGEKDSVIIPTQTSSKQKSSHGKSSANVQNTQNLISPNVEVGVQRASNHHADICKGVPANLLAFVDEIKVASEVSGSIQSITNKNHEVQIKSKENTVDIPLPPPIVVDAVSRQSPTEKMSKSKRKSVSFKPAHQNVYHSPPDYHFQEANQNSSASESRREGGGCEFSNILMTSEISEIQTSVRVTRSKKHYSSTPLPKPKKLCVASVCKSPMDQASAKPNDKIFAKPVTVTAPESASNEFLVPPPPLIATKPDTRLPSVLSALNPVDKTSLNLSYENSLNISAIPKDQTGPKWGIVFHSTPLHGTKSSKKKSRKEEPSAAHHSVEERNLDNDRTVNTSRNLRSRRKSLLSKSRSSSQSSDQSGNEDRSSQRTKSSNRSNQSRRDEQSESQGGSPVSLRSMSSGTPSDNSSPNRISIRDNTVLSSQATSHSRARDFASSKSSRSSYMTRGGSSYNSYDSHRKLPSSRRLFTADEGKESYPPNQEILGTNVLKTDSLAVEAASTKRIDLLDDDENAGYDVASRDDSVASSSSAESVASHIVPHESLRSQIDSLRRSSRASSVSSDGSEVSQPRHCRHLRPKNEQSTKSFGESKKPRSKFSMRTRKSNSENSLIFPKRPKRRYTKKASENDDNPAEWSRKPRKLFKPGKWASKKLYDWLEQKLRAEHGLRSTLMAEKVVIDLQHAYLLVSNGHSDGVLNSLRAITVELGLCTTQLEFWSFIHKFMPFDFRMKVIPMGGAFGSAIAPRTLPYDAL